MKNGTITTVLFLTAFCAMAQSTYVPGGVTANSNSVYMGIGTTVPSARFHVQQVGGGWSEGIRLSLMGKDWDVVSDAGGNRLLFSNGQNASNAVFMYASGYGPTMHVNGSLRTEQFTMMSGDGQTSFVINKPSTFSQPFQICLGSQNISGGIMIGREDWSSKVMIPWKVAIGTTTPDAGSFLTVDGKIKCEEVSVEIIPGSGPDYVFNVDYELLPLAELERYIKANRHLPDVPSAAEMEDNGLNLKEMNLLLLKKIEELTLHLVAQYKINEKQREINETIQKEIERIRDSR